MDVDAELQRAVAAHRAGDVKTAGPIYAAILKAQPEHADALHFAGLHRFHAGDSDDAVMLIERSLAVAPANAAARTNLGNVHLTEGRIERAMACYEAALDLAPEHVDAWSNLGTALRVEGRFEEAETAYRTALIHAPEHAKAWHGLGLLYLAAGHSEAAADAFEACLEHGQAGWLDPVWYARVLHAIGREEVATRRLEDYVRERPDDPVAAHQLAALRGEAVARAPDDYVRTHFDNFAADFDDVLAKLDYRAPQFVAALVAKLRGERPPVDHAIDLGCGTGLCGPLVKCHARHLTGVDLSPAMLRRAATRRASDEPSSEPAYDALVDAELVGFLKDGEPSRYGLATCVDTLIYFGPLEDAFAAVHDALSPGGLFVASLERWDGDGADYRLDPSGRYAHSRDYLVDAVARSGLRMAVLGEAVLRRELGKDVPGHIFAAERPAA